MPAEPESDTTKGGPAGPPFLFASLSPATKLPAMGGYVHKPEGWNREAIALWAAGQREEAALLTLQALDANPAPNPDAFIQPGFYLFQLERFDVATAVLERGLEVHPTHPMILLSLGTSYSRWHQPDRALPLLDRLVDMGLADATIYDALAMSHGDHGDLDQASRFGALALAEKDGATVDRHGTPALAPPGDAANRRRIIAFTLFGSRPRYLRGALHNVLAAREIYPGWTCRFHVDDSVDATFRAVLAAEGAEVIVDDSGDRDQRHLLTRRFRVADDPDVGHFLVRDCDSVVSAREAAAVAEWLASGVPFHAMRDWYSHTDPLLAGLWGGVAGMIPDVAGMIADFRAETPFNANWDQYFLRQRIWPAIRDRLMVHDRLFDAHATRPFPTPTPAHGHVGQNDYAVDPDGQAAALAAFADCIPALGLPRAVRIDLGSSGLDIGKGRP